MRLSVADGQILHLSTNSALMPSHSLVEADISFVITNTLSMFCGLPLGESFFSHQHLRSGHLLQAPSDEVLSLFHVEQAPMTGGFIILLSQAPSLGDSTGTSRPDATTSCLFCSHMDGPLLCSNHECSFFFGWFLACLSHKCGSAHSQFGFFCLLHGCL